MSSYDDRAVLVVGSGSAGAASARALLKHGARVTVVDQKPTAALSALGDLGARIVVSDAAGSVDSGLLSGVSDVVVSPGVPPYHPLAAAAVAAGIDVYSEPELAWRLRGPGAPTWLALTGTNGKTTTVTMLEAILRAAGHRTGAFGNIGEPLVELPDGLDVLAVELSSFQLHWSSRLAPEAGAILNLADDHLEWHGDFDAYAGAKEAIWRSARAGTGVAVGNADDARVAAALHRAGGSAPISFTLGTPSPATFGVLDGWLTTPDGHPIIEAERIKPAGTHNVANALAAAALAVAYGVPVEAIRDGLAGYVPEPHRNAYVTTVAGVTYVDDSKATNPHAALASLSAYPRIVWVAGGQLKGVDVDELVRTVVPRLTGAVLLGVDREEIAAALARHAPELPVVQVARTDDGAMGEVVAAAAQLAQPGDTVLLAPAAASKDMFHGYDHRGSAYAAAVRALTGEQGG
ncbi:MAG: UDP-N-acetylmuramoyl-L-alanine--D-glutamate ligase [Hamadaea sp.]|nr:UDP-N-acetylmuramoyl-L-alanine--D-glutamate ligase [Hamadaea sp.]